MSENWMAGGGPAPKIEPSRICLGTAGVAAVGVIGILLALVYLWRGSLVAPMTIAAICAFCGGTAALFLKETAPRKVREPAVDIAGAGTTSV